MLVIEVSGTERATYRRAAWGESPAATDEPNAPDKNPGCTANWLSLASRVADRRLRPRPILAGWNLYVRQSGGRRPDATMRRTLF